jgi:mono/diheme cytochrome c family protein
VRHPLLFFPSSRQKWCKLLVASTFCVCLSLGRASFSFGQDQTTVRSKSSVYAELARVPLKERAKQNPLENNPDAVIAGRKLFQEHCAKCHGNNAEGTREGPDLRVRAVQEATAGTLFSILTNGVVRRGMPVWSKLPEPERWQIVAFLKSLGACSVPNGFARGCQLSERSRQFALTVAQK